MYRVTYCRAYLAGHLDCGKYPWVDLYVEILTVGELQIPLIHILSDKFSKRLFDNSETHVQYPLEKMT